MNRSFPTLVIPELLTGKKAPRVLLLERQTGTSPGLTVLPENFR